MFRLSDDLLLAFVELVVIFLFVLCLVLTIILKLEPFLESCLGNDKNQHYSTTIDS